MSNPLQQGRYSRAELLGYSSVAAICFTIFIGSIFEANHLLLIPDARVTLFVTLTFICLGFVSLFLSLSNSHMHLTANYSHRLNPAASIVYIGLGVYELLRIGQGDVSQSRYFVFVGAQALITYCVTYLAIECTQIKGRWPQVGAIMSASLIGFIGIVHPMLDSWTVLPSIPVARDVLLGAFPVVFVLLHTLMQTSVLKNTSFVEMIGLRLRQNDLNRAEIQTLLLIIAGSIIGVSTQLVFDGMDIVPMHLVFPTWLAVGWYSLRHHLFAEQLHAQDILASSMVPAAGKKFLKRHIRQGPNWAATVGLRTPNFIINHDPNYMISDQLPASITQIRNKEIQNCVSLLLNQNTLQNRMIGTQIFGSVDPEFSVRPCVDVLCMFASLHLDASPLIERRIHGLAKLLPILDPTLSDMVTRRGLDRNLTRNPWLYYFEYDWLDQHLIHTPRDTDYTVYTNDMDNITRLSIYEFLRNRNQFGQFIWLGMQARNRLQIEAPSLSNVIQARQVTAPNGEEHLAFIIKLEELIPRLQAFYNLDDRRRILQDFISSPESQRFAKLIELQLDNCHSLKDLQKIVESLTNYPWRGFREKDDALVALIRAYELAIKMSKDAELHEAIRVGFIQAILRIGYPTQILHIAQINKLALRVNSNITQVASKPWDARFEEAWLMLATNPLDGLGTEQRLQLLEFLCSVPDNRYLTKRQFVMAKAIEAVFNVTAFGVEFPDLTAQTLDRYGRWLVESRADLEIFSFFIDLHHHASRSIDNHKLLSEKTTRMIEMYLSGLERSLKAQSQYNATINRWTERAAS